jgi:hypothetical protein
MLRRRGADSRARRRLRCGCDDVTHVRFRLSDWPRVNHERGRNVLDIHVTWAAADKQPRCCSGARTYARTHARTHACTHAHMSTYIL